MEEIINLEKNTQYKEDEIKEWFRFIGNIEASIIKFPSFFKVLFLIF